MNTNNPPPQIIQPLHLKKNHHPLPPPAKNLNSLKNNTPITPLKKINLPNLHDLMKKNLQN